MSNSKNILYLISLMLLMLTGCEADTSIAPFPNEGEELVEVRLHATTVGAGVEVARANGETIPLPEDTQIGMTGGTYQNLTLNYNNSATPNLSTANGSKIYYPLQTETMNIYAYAPYSPEAYDEQDNTVLVRSLFDEQNTSRDHYITDPIWATTAVTKEQAVNGVVSASLQFKHVMSKLQIYLVNDTGEKTYSEIDLSLVFDRLQYGKMSMQTGEVTTANTREETYKRRLENTNLLPQADTATPQYDYTVFPGSVLQQIYISMRDVNDNVWRYEYNFTADGNTSFPAFEAGKINRMIIDFGKIEHNRMNGIIEDFEFDNNEEEL